MFTRKEWKMFGFFFLFWTFIYNECIHNNTLSVFSCRLCHSFELSVESDSYVFYYFRLCYPFYYFIINHVSTQRVLFFYHSINYYTMCFHHPVSRCASLPSTVSASLECLLMFVFLLWSLRCFHLFFFPSNLFVAFFSNITFPESILFSIYCPRLASI